MQINAELTFPPKRADSKSTPEIFRNKMFRCLLLMRKPAAIFLWNFPARFVVKVISLLPLRSVGDISAVVLISFYADSCARAELHICCSQPSPPPSCPCKPKAPMGVYSEQDIEERMHEVQGHAHERLDDAHHEWDSECACHICFLDTHIACRLTHTRHVRRRKR